MIHQLNGRAEQVFDGKMNNIQLFQKSHFNEAMAHIAAMDFFGLRYCLIMDPFVQSQRAVADIPY